MLGTPLADWVRMAPPARTAGDQGGTQGMGISAIDTEWSDLSETDRRIIMDALNRVGVFGEDVELSCLRTRHIREIIVAACNALRLVRDSQQYFDQCIDAVYAAADRRRR